MDPTVSTIILADAQVLVRQGIRLLLQSNGAFNIAAETGDPSSLPDLLVQHQPDILIIDVSMRPPADALVQDIKRFAPDARIVVLTMLASEEAVFGTLRAGADAYLLKEASLDELLLALDSVNQGRCYISSGISSLLIDGLRSSYPRPRHDARWHLLTPREREVLRHVTRGKKTKEIALQLHRSVKTIEKHRANIKRKLGTSTTSEMKAYGVRLGLLQGRFLDTPATDMDMLPPDPSAP